MRASGALGVPNGWFAVGLSSEISSGQVVTRAVCGEPVVLFRGRSGGLSALAAHCPHLGAHLGRGTVVGETLRCAFHGFRFDAGGACVLTGYGTRPPPSARSRCFPLRETGGVIFIYVDAAGRAPAWEPPPLDSRGFSPTVFHRWTLDGHPEQTTENAVDIGHFSWVHGFRDVKETTAPRFEGAHLVTRYSMTYPLLAHGRFGSLRVDYEVHAHGLGYSRVDVGIPSLRLGTRHLVLATPTDPGRIDLRIGLSVGETPLPERLGDGPQMLARRLLAPLLMGLFRKDVARDFDIWRSQRHMSAPALAQGDGPIAQYRRWARQFYGTTDAATASPPTKRRGAVPLL